jgi:RNA 3'-terminal phosphate cyclase (ATP)
MESFKQDFIEIDGSYGEGGGQILRTSLALSAILRVPVHIHHIRAGRKKPGLQAQHLRGAEALTQITGAQTDRMKIGSQSISFIPQAASPGEYRFEVGTAGSVILLLQAMLPPLCLSQGRSRLTLIGGSHVPWSPPFHYFRKVVVPFLRIMGVSVEAILERWGWYPKGGGVVQIIIDPVHELRPIVMLERGAIKGIRGICATSHLPEHVGERLKAYAVKRIERELRIESRIDVFDDVPANGPGAFIFLWTETEGAIAGFSSLGERGKRAEEVAREAVEDLKAYYESEGCLDPHLADQVLPFLALTKGNSAYTTTKITGHLLTNLWVLRQFLKVKTLIRGKEGDAGGVELFNE